MRRSGSPCGRGREGNASLRRLRANDRWGDGRWGGVPVGREWALCACLARADVPRSGSRTMIDTARRHLRVFDGAAVERQPECRSNQSANIGTGFRRAGTRPRIRRERAQRVHQQPLVPGGQHSIQTSGLDKLPAKLYYSPIMAARDVQLSLPSRPTWGGRRRGAGRKGAPGRRPGVPHRARPAHMAPHPVHATLRAVRGLGSLRSRPVVAVVQAALSRASNASFRLVEFSVQSDHVHLIVEAESRRALALGLRGLAIRVALAVNRVLGRRGSVWADRYHARALTTPRAVRHALVYVLMNFRKHHGPGRGLDTCSSAAWFEGWQDHRPSQTSPRPVATARTWLAKVGWRRHGLIALTETPRGG